MSGNDGRFDSYDHGFDHNDHGYDSNDHGYDHDDHGYGLGVGLGAGLGAGNLQKNHTDYQRVKCQVWDVRVTYYFIYTNCRHPRNYNLRERRQPILHSSLSSHDIDDGHDVANVHGAVAVDVGGSLFGLTTYSGHDVNHRHDVTHVHLAVAVDVTLRAG